MKKKKIRLDRVLIALAIVVLLGIVIWLLFFPPSKTSGGQDIPDDVESNIDKYGYVLKKNQTELFKNQFKELENILNQDPVDEEAYAVALTKLFIEDFYNLDNKATSTDIGGVQFVHSAAKDNFILNASDTMYAHVENNVYGDRVQTLPKVKEVLEANISKVSFTYGETTDDAAYEVTAKWSYEEDLGYDTEKTFVFVHEDNKLSLVEMK